MDNGIRDRQKGKYGGAQAQGAQSHRKHGPASPAGKHEEPALYYSKKVGREIRKSERYDHGGKDEAILDIKHVQQSLAHRKRHLSCTATRLIGRYL
jgi:hypothetical protein